MKRVTTEELQRTLAHLKQTHPKEIGGRVADVSVLIEEVIESRAQLAAAHSSISFEGLHAEYLRWVKATFPDETAREQWVHLCEEVEELGEDLTKADEYADVMMLLCCVANQNGINALLAFREKFEVNKARTWRKTERGFRHEKSA